jgi:hypothetical protein
MSVRFQSRTIAVVVISLAISLGIGFWAGYSYFRGATWYDEQFRDNVALTQNAFENLFSEFGDILGGGSLDEENLRELQSWVEKTSVQSAKVTFLDENHFDLWDWTSDSLELFEDFLEDILATVRTRSEDEKTITMDQDSIDRLENVYDDLKTFYEHVFPVDVLEEGTMWATPHYSEMDAAIGMLSRFKEDVARAWLILPVLSGSAAPPPEVQARELLIEAVGEDYFVEYFEFKGVQYNYWEPDAWLTHIAYSYHIQVGNYTATREVYFHFDKMNRFIGSQGVPPADNLMPFKVSKEEAINTALGRVTQSYLEVEAEILFVKRSVNDVPLNKYVWQVVFYLTKKSAPSGSVIEVLIDLHNGEVFDVARLAWTSM